MQLTNMHSICQLNEIKSMEANSLAKQFHHYSYEYAAASSSLRKRYNIQSFFSAVKIENFTSKNFDIFNIKTYIVGTH